jgi:F-type H+-transporting ATPase subunit b
MININWSTLLLQIVNFVVMVLILTKFFFKPVLNALDERSKRVTNALDEAEKREREAQEMHAEYNKKLLEANELIVNMKQKAQEELEQTKQQLIAEAQEEIQQMRQKTESEIEESRQLAIYEHRRELGQLVTILSARLIREAGGDAFQDAALEEFVGRLRSLTADGWQPRSHGYEPDAGEDQVVDVQLVSASELDAKNISRIKAKVRTLIGLPVEMRHKVDPALVAGATLRFGDTMIDGSLEGQLESLRAQYLRDLDRRDQESQGLEQEST